MRLKNIEHTAKHQIKPIKPAENNINNGNGLAFKQLNSVN